MEQNVQKFLAHRLSPLSGKGSNEVLKAFGEIESVGSFTEVATAFQDLSHVHPFAVRVDMTILGKGKSTETILLYVVTVEEPESKSLTSYISIVHNVSDNTVNVQLDSFFASFNFQNEPTMLSGGIREIPYYWEQGPVSKVYVVANLF